MASGPKLVHKQFNSPMGLYSQHNIQETLNKHLKNLDNGSVGIDFNNTNTDKPANLANSAVLRMLEEEERDKRGYPKLDPTQVQAILDTLVHANHRFDPVWPPQQARMKSARSWDGHLNANSHIYSELLKATSKGSKKVVWPPAPETNGYHSPQKSPGQQQQYPSQQAYSAPNQYQQQQYQPQSQQHQPQSQQHQPQSQQHQPQTQQYQPPSYQYQSPAQQYQTAVQQQQAPPQQYQAPSQQYPKAQSSAVCEGKVQGSTGLSRLIPVGPGATAAPTPSYRPGPPSPAAQPQPYRQQNNRWAPVPAPLSPQGYNSSQQSYPSQGSYSPQQSPYSPQQSPYSPQQSPYSESIKPFSPPPTTITLRQQQPIHQKPSPVFQSQPAAASFKGGVNMRGDTKWPPQTVREAVEAENEARRQLAKGPACRPRKVRKDYSQFFAQNALNHNTVGYRAPPGTQHYEDYSGRSSY